MEKLIRDQLIKEVRERLSEIDKKSNPDKLGGGWTNLHLQALVEEIDELNKEINHDPFRPINS